MLREHQNVVSELEARILQVDYYFIYCDINLQEREILIREKASVVSEFENQIEQERLQFNHVRFTMDIVAVRLIFDPLNEIIV